ncbi:myosin-binding protein 3-like [Phalaenopsis equestris]|uniref:myosin-binding protein 3-like n=1 Tax=Phalaenopsis equestris TaxID=78828 RepID=UPI0009E5BE3C|nr:myosin-binding protein 3-like [Phalaenopsis equestris]
MAANRFATMLHRNTHRMAFLLIYTVLEWILIALLLLSALFSFLIAKFASFFGLKPPCIFCTRVDHLFQPGKGQRFCKDIICDSHAVEISKLGFCSKHQRLSDAGDMCEDCATSGFGETDRKVALLSWMKQRSALEEKDLVCSCCGVIHESRSYSSYTILHTEPSDVLECAQKDRSVKEETEGEKDGAVGPEKADLGREIPSAHAEEIEDQKEEAHEKEHDFKSETLLPSPCYVVEDALATILAFHPKKTVDDERILPIELIDSSTMVRCGVRGHHVDDKMLLRDAAERETAKIDIAEIAEQQSSTVTIDDAEDVSFGGGKMTHQETIHVELVPVINAEEFEDLHVSEEESKVNEEVNCEISIGSDICDQEQIEHAQIHESIPEPEFQQDQNLESFNETTDREIVTEPEPLKRSARQVKHLAIPPVLNEIVEEGMPETPTTPYSIEGFPVLPKRFLLERRESGTESLDGSIASDLDSMEPWTLERLKAALKAERKSLTALYAELEEERSASAIAANQTMAMITRLQEEKAAMQMEALHYQRMMEEQTEYDQEALQVLNELILKREKEKQELEEELELYHEKVLMYEASERNKNTGNESVIASGLSISEDSDDLSFEFHEGEESNCSHNENKQNTPSAEILSFVESSDTMDVCLTEFEENRISILKKLKALVEKLFKMDDKDETDDSESRKQCWVENGHKVNGERELLGDDINYGSVNCSSHDLQINGKLRCEQRSAGIQGKNLLPLFDAIRLESEEKLSTKDDSIDGSSPDSISKFSVGLKKVAIAEELDEVYKRLQALEADRDFIKHCISSMKKGKKGVNLLQEILQNLDDLRRVQLHSRSSDF